jgi:S1-C subfamily serine protease
MTFLFFLFKVMFPEKKLVMAERNQITEITKTGASAPAFDAQALFEQYRDSAVNVFDNVAFGALAIPQTLGSGFAIDVNAQKGFCRTATDNHVVKDAASLMVRMSDGNEYPAILEHSDPANDLAILRIDGIANLEKVCKPIQLVDGTDAVTMDESVIKLTARMQTPDYAVATVEEYFKRSLARGLPLLPGENSERIMLSAAGPSDTGDSGGAIVTAKGAVGVQDANGPGQMGITPAMYLKRDLEDVKKND